MEIACPGRDVEEAAQFLGLWLDEEMLLDEFDAIVAAGWPVERPTKRPGGLWRDLLRPRFRAQGSPSRWMCGLATEARSGQNVNGPGRERSPPLVAPASMSKPRRDVRLTGTSALARLTFRRW